MATNLCTVVAYFHNPSEERKGLGLEYECRTGCQSVRACSYFKPMRMGDGMQCLNECEHFEYGCTCKKARAAALSRASRMWNAKMSGK